MIKDFCNDLNLFLIDAFKYKTLPASIHFDTIDVSRKKVELYIRFKTDNLIWKKDTLVLARLAFERKRKGNGKNLLTFLVNHAEKYDYKRIGIEQTNNKASAFAEKYGFQDMGERRHWVIRVEDLKVQLRKYQSNQLEVIIGRN